MRILFCSICVFMFSSMSIGPLETSPKIWADALVPSQWKGEIVGQVHGHSFRLPVSIEFSPPLPHENNPLHLFIGVGNPKAIGNIYISSAMRFSTSRGPATLQYFTIYIQGSRLQAKLTDHHGAEAAKGNGFTGPNVSAEQASDLMKDVLRNAWGATEMFGFDVGASLVIRFSGNELYGSIQGRGGSYTGTSSQVQYRAELRARRIK